MALVILPIRDSLLAIPIGVVVFALIAAATGALSVGAFGLWSAKVGASDLGLSRHARTLARSDRYEEEV